jgi:hypothetical protein
MSEKSEMRAVTRKTYDYWVDFELKRLETGTWKNIQGKGRGVDVNSNGLGFTTEIPLEAGEVLRLNLPLIPPETSIPVFSEVRWTLPEGVKYRVGLQFLS